MARNSCGAVSCRCSLVVDKGIRAYVAPEFCCGLEPLYRLLEGTLVEYILTSVRKKKLLSITNRLTIW